MATAPRTACRFPLCPALTHETYCEKHRAKARKATHEAYDSTRGNTTERGYGAAWRRIRFAHLLSEPLCRHCKRDGQLTVANEVDHILPKLKGGSDHENNLQSLCRYHHRIKTAEEMTQP